jgi:hypothetical protein
VRDPRLVTIRRGGTLGDADHRLLALWAATCAEHVLDLFEVARPEDPRPRQAIEQVRAWAHGEATMAQARAAGGHAMAAARELKGAARHAAFAAIRAVQAAAPDGAGERAGRSECQWQRDRLPPAIRALVIDDQRVRNEICWSVFDC